MAKTTKKMTKEEKAALEVQAMLQGVTVDELLGMSADTEEDDEMDTMLDEAANEMEKKPKKKTSKPDDKENKPKKKRISPNDIMEERPKKVEDKITIKPEFSKFKESDEVNVTFNYHEIPYKEQLWPVPSRVVVYEVELVTKPMVAKNISYEVNGKSEDEANKAYNGDTMYYRIVTYENVKSDVRIIGYIKLFTDGSNKVKSRLVTNKSWMKKVNINIDKFAKEIQKVLINLERK